MDLEIMNLSLTVFEYAASQDGNSRTNSSFKVLIWIAFVLGIVASIVLIYCLLRLKQQSAVSRVLISWAWANILFISKLVPSYMKLQESWEFWCHAGPYLNKSIGYAMPYLLVIAAVLLLIGTENLWKLSGQNPMYFYMMPFLMATEVWVVSFLLCIMYWPVHSYKKMVLLNADLEICSYETAKGLPRVELVLMYVLPSVLLFSLLITWVCPQRCKLRKDSGDQVWAIVLITFLILYILTQLDQIAILPFGSIYESVSVNQTAIHFPVAIVLALFYHALAPVSALFIMFIYRQTINSNESATPNKLNPEKSISLI